MVIGSKRIEHLLDIGVLVINPRPRPEAIQPASVDLRLGDQFRVISKNGSIIDPSKGAAYEEVSGVSEFVLYPQEFCLAHTIEEIKLPVELMASLEGRSSIGRMGLFIHNAGHVDPGFHGQLTLELFNAAPVPIRLYPGMRICQIVFQEVKDAHFYRGKYLGQRGATPSRIYKDF